MAGSYILRKLVSNVVLRSRTHRCNCRQYIPFKHQYNWEVCSPARSISTSAKIFRWRDDGGYDEVETPERPIDHPIRRTLKILKHDLRSIYDKSQPPLLEIPLHVDIVIIGGGIIGSSIAYFLKERTPKDALSVLVIEKDPTYTRSQTALSAGCLRQQFSLKENIQMAQFGAEFLRLVPKKLSCGGQAPPDIQYHPYGYLQFANEEQAPALQETWLLQKELGCHVELLTNERLKDRFPWINTEGIELALYGTENEGWFDAWALLFGLKRKAIYHGTTYAQADVVGFGFDRSMFVVAGMEAEDEHEIARRVIVRMPSGELKTVDFGMCIIAAGHESGDIAEMARIGRREGLLSVPLPIESRKRHVYCIQAPDGPGIDCPLVADTDGTYFRREGYAGHFVAGQAAPVDEINNPKDCNPEADYAYFDKVVWPSLSNRVAGFKNVKLNSAWTGYYDYNTFDQSGIVGPHPYHPNMYFACGFSGHGIQQAPAIGRATMEMILDGEFRTIDLTKYHFERFLVGKEIKEKHVN